MSNGPEDFSSQVQSRVDAAERQRQASIRATEMERSAEQHRQAYMRSIIEKARSAQEIHEGTSLEKVFSAEHAKLCEEFLEHMANNDWRMSRTIPKLRLPTERSGILGALADWFTGEEKPTQFIRGYKIGIAGPGIVEMPNKPQTYAQRVSPNNVFLCEDGLLRSVRTGLGQPFGAMPMPIKEDDTLCEVTVGHRINVTETYRSNCWMDYDDKSRIVVRFMPRPLEEVLMGIATAKA